MNNYYLDMEETAAARRDKSRTLTVYGYFEALQLEWIIADLRLRLYPKTKDKEYWKRVRDGKEVTIKQISEKNGNLPTIFDDPVFKSECEKKVFGEKSHPNFLYQDENKKNQQEYYDLTNYYSKDCDVRCDVNGEIKIGKVKSFNPLFDKHVTVVIAGVEEKVLVGDVTRIL